MFYNDETNPKLTYPTLTFDKTRSQFKWKPDWWK